MQTSSRGPVIHTPRVVWVARPFIICEKCNFRNMIVVRARHIPRRLLSLFALLNTMSLEQWYSSILLFWFVVWLIRYYKLNILCKLKVGNELNRWKMRIGSSATFFQHTDVIIIKYLHTNHLLHEYLICPKGWQHMPPLMSLSQEGLKLIVL